MPWTSGSFLTKEEYDRQTNEEREVHDLLMAVETNDWDTANRLLGVIDFPPEALMAIKRVDGPDKIRELGVRTESAERKYGKNWLDA